MGDVLTRLRRVSTTLSDAMVPHAFIGAMGRLAWGTVRATNDLDVQVAVAPAEWAACVDALATAGFRLDLEYGDTGPPPDNARFYDDVGFRLDVMTDKTRFQQQVVARATVQRVLGTDILVESPEDLVLYKLIASRPKDLDDIDDVLRTRHVAGLPVDWAYIEGHARDWDMRDAVQILRAQFGSLR